MQATDSAQGGHKLLHLQTKSIITRNRVIPAPITPIIINQVHSIIDREVMPIGVRISNRTVIILYEDAWIAGVDYSQDDDNENEFENELGYEEDDDT